MATTSFNVVEDTLITGQSIASGDSINIDIINNLELTFAAALSRQENVWFYSGEGKNKRIQKIWLSF